MVLAFVSDPLDEEHASGHFYHICQGVMQKEEVLPPPLEMEDFMEAHLRGAT